MKTTLTALLCLLAALSAVSAPPEKKSADVCLVNFDFSSPMNTLVLHDVGPLAPARSIALHGLFFTRANRLAPVHGSATMTSGGGIRLGVFVHSTADASNDFTVSGVAAADYSGTLNFDNDGDFKPNGTLEWTRVDCATITVP